MHANSISMSIRTATSLGRLNSAAPSLTGALRPIQQTIPQTASKQLTRLSSTTARPLGFVTLNPDSRPQAKATCPSTTGLRSQSTAAPSNGEVKLDWDSFFKLRASRRRYSLASSIVTSLASTTAGVQVLSGQDLEALGGAVMGLDPFVVLGLATAACGAAGWLVGPVVGNGVWGLVYRKYKPSVNTVSIHNPTVESHNSPDSTPTISYLLATNVFYPCHRKRRNSLIVSVVSESTHPPTRSPTPSLITMARRSVVCRVIGSG
jgi:import inner membrane translocase subunit TIM23